MGQAEEEVGEVVAGACQRKSADGEVARQQAREAERSTAIRIRVCVQIGPPEAHTRLQIVRTANKRDGIADAVGLRDVQVGTRIVQRGEIGEREVGRSEIVWIVRDAVDAKRRGDIGLAGEKRNRGAAVAIEGPGEHIDGARRKIVRPTQIGAHAAAAGLVEIAEQLGIVAAAALVIEVLGEAILLREVLSEPDVEVVGILGDRCGEDVVVDGARLSGKGDEFQQAERRGV